MSARAFMLAAIAAVVAGPACGGDNSDPAHDARVVMLTCNPEAQDCPADQKCNPTGPALGPWEGTMCVPDNAANGSPAGTPCFTGPDATDTCDEISTCLQLGFGEGVCLAYCTEAPADTCDATERCVLYDAAIGLKLCTLRCDLVANDCPLTFNCIDTLAGPACIPAAIQDRVPRG